MEWSVGGAFGGAVPQVIYPLLLRDLAESGYTVIATPFSATFKHLTCAEEMDQRFRNALEELRLSPFAEKVPTDVPLHGIGHSFGALAHSLIGCSEKEDIRSNVLISFNNKAVSEAIPIPGFLETTTTAFQIYDQSPLRSLPDPLPFIKTAAKGLIQGIEPTGGLSRKTVDDALDQLESVFREIREGIVDFDPPPPTSAEMIASNYNVPETLLLRFSDDTIDETAILRDLLERSPAQRTTFQTVPGTHLTPCVGDIRWLREIIDFTVDDDLAETLQRDTVLNTRALVRTVVDWLDGYKPLSR